MTEQASVGRTTEILTVFGCTRDAARVCARTFPRAWPFWGLAVAVYAGAEPAIDALGLSDPSSLGIVRWGSAAIQILISTVVMAMLLRSLAGDQRPLKLDRRVAACVATMIVLALIGVFAISMISVASARLGTWMALAVLLLGASLLYVEVRLCLWPIGSLLGPAIRGPQRSWIWMGGAMWALVGSGLLLIIPASILVAILQMLGTNKAIAGVAEQAIGSLAIIWFQVLSLVIFQARSRASGAA